MQKEFCSCTLDDSFTSTFHLPLTCKIQSKYFQHLYPKEIANFHLDDPVKWNCTFFSFSNQRTYKFEAVLCYDIAINPDGCASQEKDEWCWAQADIQPWYATMLSIVNLESEKKYRENTKRMITDQCWRGGDRKYLSVRGTCSY